ncbi:hypothetical protein [Rhodococcus sp. SJ-2]
MSNTLADVVAWNDDGEPLVMNHKAGDLQVGMGPIHQSPGDRVRQIMPGTGYTVIYQPGQPSQLTAPLLAWGVTYEGSVIPLDTDSGGLVEKLPDGALVMPDVDARRWLASNPTPPIDKDTGAATP